MHPFPTHIPTTCTPSYIHKLLHVHSHPCIPTNMHPLLQASTFTCSLSYMHPLLNVPSTTCILSYMHPLLHAIQSHCIPARQTLYTINNFLQKRFHFFPRSFKNYWLYDFSKCLTQFYSANTKSNERDILASILINLDDPNPLDGLTHSIILMFYDDYGDVIGSDMQNSNF